MFAYLVAFLAVLLTILYRSYHNRNAYLRNLGLKSLPGPRGLPWLGYLLWIDSKAPYETFARLASKYGQVYSLKLGGLTSVFISDPALIRQAFSRDVFAGRAPLYLTHGIMKGHGLVCSEGNMWREHRKFMVNVMKQLGMAGRKPNLMESRIMDGVHEFIRVC